MGRHFRFPENILRRLVFQADGCIIWTGKATGSGYGQVNSPEGRKMVHRITWEWVNGPVPDGLQLDHLCRVRRCCHPGHLEAVTLRENLRRGINHQRLKTQCPRGHPYEGANLYVGPTGDRRCRACARDRQRRARSVTA